jgi:hypothetical protein
VVASLKQGDGLGGVFGQDGTRRFRQAASRFHDLGITSRIQRGLGISGTGDDHGESLGNSTRRGGVSGTGDGTGVFPRATQSRVASLAQETTTEVFGHPILVGVIGWCLLGVTRGGATPQRRHSKWWRLRSGQQPRR